MPGRFLQGAPNPHTKCAPAFEPGEPQGERPTCGLRCEVGPSRGGCREWCRSCYLPVLARPCLFFALGLCSGTFRITGPLITSTYGQEGLSLRAENSVVCSPSCCRVLLLGEAAAVVMRHPAKEAGLVSLRKPDLTRRGGEE